MTVTISCAEIFVTRLCVAVREEIKKAWHASSFSQTGAQPGPKSTSRRSGFAYDRCGLRFRRPGTVVIGLSCPRYHRRPRAWHTR